MSRESVPGHDISYHLVCFDETGNERGRDSADVLYDARQGVTDVFFQMLIALRFLNAIEITAKSSDSGSDRHLVIIEQYYQPGLKMARLVYRFHRHAAGQ